MGEFLLHSHASRATFGTDFTAEFYLVETHLFLSLFHTVCDFIQGYELQFMMLYSESCVCVYICLSVLESGK